MDLDHGESRATFRLRKKWVRSLNIYSLGQKNVDCPMGLLLLLLFPIFGTGVTEMNLVPFCLEICSWCKKQETRQLQSSAVNNELGKILYCGSSEDRHLTRQHSLELTSRELFILWPFLLPCLGGKDTASVFVPRWDTEPCRCNLLLTKRGAEGEAFRVSPCMAFGMLRWMIINK